MASRTSSTSSLRTRAVRLVAALAMGGFASLALAQAGPLPPGVEELARSLESAKIYRAPKDSTPPTTAIDLTAPSARLPAQIDQLTRLLKTSAPNVKPSVRLALANVQQAWAAFYGGAPDESLSHLNACLAALQPAEQALDDAVAAADSSADVALIEVQRQLSLTAQRIADDVYGQAKLAGVSKERLKPAKTELDAGDRLLDAGSHTGAVGRFANGLGLAANTIVFSIDRFESNIHAAFDPASVGNAYAVSLGGVLKKFGHHGQARTAADAPVLDQSDTKPMHIASASKLLTAIVTMRLLADKGLSPDTPIAGYLPSNWALGDGVELLTFADVMTHKTGFAQKSDQVKGEDYAPLRDRIALPVGDHGAKYSNANFALLRVLSSRLQGADPVDYAEFDAGAFTTAMFLIKAQSLFSSVGASASCHSEDPTPTVQYRFPDTGKAGYQEPDRDLSCGGYGWQISARDYTRVLANLRYTGNLMPPASLAEMRSRYLGLMSPTMFSAYVNGKFGVYHGHGGDWGHGEGGLDTCAYMFPIIVEASVWANSNSGNYGGVGHQCKALIKAFDDAWVPN